MNRDILIHSDTALVLEGGGMRGFYTMGVLDYFLEAGIHFPAIYAVSAGSCHAMSYLSKQRGRAYDIGIGCLDDWRYCSARSLLLTGDLFGAKYLYDTIPNKLFPFDYDTFEKNPSKLIAVCSNVETGKAEYIPIKDARTDILYVRASSSMPLVSRIVKTPRGNLLDGGVCDSIPIRHALAHHKRAVAVLTQPAGFVKQPSSSQKLIALRYARFPKLVEASRRRHEDYNDSLTICESASSSGSAFILRPTKALGIERMEKDPEKLRSLYALGYHDAKTGELTKFLNQ